MTACSTNITPANLGSTGTLFKDHSSGTSSRTYRILRPVFAQLWSVFDQFITQNDEVPWWYTERSLVGLMTAAAFRAGCSAIEEFTCARHHKRSRGRVDWWVGTGADDEELFAETKQAYISSDGGWALLSSGFKHAEAQLRDYDLGQEYDHVPRLLIVFVRPYFKNGKDWIEQRNLWLTETPEGADYCAYYWLEREHQDRCVSDGGYCYPGILICCKEAEAAHTEKELLIGQADSEIGVVQR